MIAAFRWRAVLRYRAPWTLYLHDTFTIALEQPRGLTETFSGLQHARLKWPAIIVARRDFQRQ
jgi:hypothetical protein